MRLLALALALALLTVAPEARAESSIRLRVLTWNVWGVPLITSSLDQRMAAIPDAIVALDPDLVVLQELWTAAHADAVTKRLAERGLRHARRFETPGGATGLFVASKRPLGTATFRPFSIGRMPHSIWHLDWLVEKGVGSVTVETPLGPLRVENTHLQAQYRTDRYGPERLGQAAELVHVNRGRADEPLVVAGDFNGDGGELPRRTLRDLGGLEDARPESAEDSVYVRGGRDSTIRIVSARAVLGAPFSLAGGAREPLSDHEGLLVELELTRCAACPPVRRVTSSTRAASIASLERAADGTPFRVAFALFTAFSLLVLGVAWKRRSGRLIAGSRFLSSLRLSGFALLAAGFVWSSYLGIAYYPTRSTALRQIARHIEAMPER